VIDSMERETGFEPVTSSLGSRCSIDNKEHMRLWRNILTSVSHRKSTLYRESDVNGVNGVKNPLPLIPLNYYRLVLIQTA